MHLLCSALQSRVTSGSGSRFILLDFAKVPLVDGTVWHTLRDMEKALNAKRTLLIFCGARDAVRAGGEMSRGSWCVGGSCRSFVLISGVKKWFSSYGVSCKEGLLA